MRTIRNSFGGLAIIGGLIGSLNFVHAQTATVGSFNGDIMQGQSAQTDSIVGIVAESQGLHVVPSDQVPRYGTFWTVSPGLGSRVIPPFPCPPLDASLPIYAIADRQFLVDGTIGSQVTLNTPQAGRLAAVSTRAAALEAQANAVLNLITQIQTMAANQQMQAMDAPVPPNFGDGGNNSDGGFSSNFQPQVFTTNDLWMQVQMANTTGSLVIHPPWNVTNGVYDLFYTTNLAPSAWQWLLRCVPGQTNLTVTGLADPQGFFILGLTNDADGDGLTDAYEKLVSHTDPNNPYSNLDGLPDGWEAMLGLNPQVSNPAQPGTRANYLYYSSDWLHRVSGVKNETVGLDNEGNVLSVSQ
jgi:hypothetical protein